MSSSEEPFIPIIRFHQWASIARPPMRADRSANGTLPVRAVRYCEALTSASAFGWWVFSPVEIEMVWDGVDIFWRFEEEPDWKPLQPSVQLPNYVQEFDAAAPDAIRGCSPPFLTVMPEPGNVQIWTGLVAQTAPGWHLLVRAPVNMLSIGGICLFEGIVQTDHWFGPLFANLRFTRTHIPIRVPVDYPLLQVQPLQLDAYSDSVLGRVDLVAGLSSMTSENWDAYYRCIVEPNSRPDRPLGEYARRARKQSARLRAACANRSED
jgi:hypothetical protein